MNKRQRKKYDYSPLTSYREERLKSRRYQGKNINRKAKRLIESGVNPRNRWEKVIMDMYKPPKYRWRTLYDAHLKARVKKINT